MGMMIRTIRVFEPGTVLNKEVELLAWTVHLEGRVVELPFPIAALS